MTDTPNPTQQQKKTGLQWRGKDFSFARPQSSPALPTNPLIPPPPVNTSTAPPSLAHQPSHPLTPTQPEHTDAQPTVLPSLDLSAADASRTLGPAPSEHKPVVNIKSVPKLPALPVYSPMHAGQSRGLKSPVPVLTAPPQPKVGATVRPVVSSPLVVEDRKRKADQMLPANTPEQQYKRRVVQALQIDAKGAGQPALTPFLSCEDVLTRLLPFHIFQPVEHDTALDAARDEELHARYQRLLEEYHARSAALTAPSTCAEETLLMERLLWSEQREELTASRELLNKYLAQLQQQRQLQQQLLLNSAPSTAHHAMHGTAQHAAPLAPGAVKVLASTPHTAPRPPLNVAVMSPGLGKTGLLSAQTMALIHKVAHQRPGVVTPVNVVSVPPSHAKEEHVINLTPQHKS